VKYLYNVETTYEIEADSEEAALDILNGDPDSHADASLRDRDVMLVGIEA
jgi:hypothetical protein